MLVVRFFTPIYLWAHILCNKYTKTADFPVFYVAKLRSKRLKTNLLTDIIFHTKGETPDVLVTGMSQG